MPDTIACWHDTDRKCACQDECEETNRCILEVLDSAGYKVTPPDPKREVHPTPTGIQNGLYRHYKGGIYDVYGLSQRESTGEWEVLYRNPRSGQCFHRPASEWGELVMLPSPNPGVKRAVPRFARVEQD